MEEAEGEGTGAFINWKMEGNLLLPGPPAGTQSCSDLDFIPGKPC